MTTRGVFAGASLAVAAYCGAHVLPAPTAGASAPILPEADAASAPTFVQAAAPSGEARLIKASFLPEFTSSAATLHAIESFRSAQGGSSVDRASVNARDLDCLTEAVYFESRGEPIAGQAAVAQVILNRSRHPAFPKTVCGVIYQGRGTATCQFSFACKSTPARRGSAGWREAHEVALAALDGSAPDRVGTATHFHATRVRPNWGGLSRVSTVGSHVFYRFAGKRGQATAFARAPSSSGRGLAETFAAAVKSPLDAALAAPAVATVAPVPPPVIGVAQPSSTLDGAAESQIAAVSTPNPAAVQAELQAPVLAPAELTIS